MNNFNYYAPVFPISLPTFIKNTNLNIFIIKIKIFFLKKLKIHFIIIKFSSYKTIMIYVKIISI